MPRATRDSESHEDKPKDLLVIESTRDFTCADCGAAQDRGALLTMDDAGPLCMACADLSHLEFLARGDTALTRRARKHSTLSAVVVRWSRRRRYERQGIIAESDAIEQAEQECLADAEARERRRIRAVVRREDEDNEFVDELAAAIRDQFPACPPDRAARIARHAGERSSGRIGRTAAGRALDPVAVRLAVVASVRHEDTDYDELLMGGIERFDAREMVRPTIDETLDRWCSRNEPDSADRPGPGRGSTGPGSSVDDSARSAGNSGHSPGSDPGPRAGAGTS